MSVRMKVIDFYGEGDHVRSCKVMLSHNFHHEKDKGISAKLLMRLLSEVELRIDKDDARKFADSLLKTSLPEQEKEFLEDLMRLSR